MVRTRPTRSTWSYRRCPDSCSPTYRRYGAFGGDIGGAASGWLGALYPDQVAGIHLIHPPLPASFDEPPLSPTEQAFMDAEEAYDQADNGYSGIMGTRPDTIAAAAAERARTNIQHWSVPGRGGHFVPLEEPDLLADELRQVFKSR